MSNYSSVFIICLVNPKQNENVKKKKEKKERNLTAAENATKLCCD